jgi:hypothetical protein
VTSDAPLETPESDPDYAAAAELWNAMTQADRQRLLLLVLRLHDLVDGDWPAAGAGS